MIFVALSSLHSLPLHSEYFVLNYPESVFVGCSAHGFMAGLLSIHIFVGSFVVVSISDRCV